MTRERTYARTGATPNVSAISWSRAQKSPFWSFLAKKNHFGQFLAKMVKTVKIIKRALGTFFSRLQALTNCKVSEKVMNGFREKA